MLKIYKETRADTRPTASASIVSIPIPSQDNPQRTRFSTLPSPGHDEEVIRDEEAFARRYAATQGSVYFRQRKTYPRSFLWRVVGDNRYLEIQSVDLTKSGNETHEAHHTLRFKFQDAIIPHGVALADPVDHEVLNVFVITTSRQLYTFSLRPEFFRRIASIDENVLDWCKISRPAPLAFAHPHRLHASGPYELFISLDSGALLRLTRKVGDDGTNWSPLTFDEKPWGSSLRGLVKWGGHQSIQYGGRSLDPNTANAIATTSDQAFVFVVGLNHTLKIWNLAGGKMVASKDLLNRSEQQQQAAPATLSPSESAFIRVFNAERAMEGELYYVVTYSPHEDGQFKFWIVKGGLTSQLEIVDLFPNTKLRPADPDPSGNVFWNVTDFQIKSMEEGRRMALWVLWRSNNLHQLYSLHFDLADLENAWHDRWTSTAFESRRDEPPPSLLQSDVVEPTEKWLDYIFYLGRYTPEVLGTALAIYQDALKERPVLGQSKKMSLQQQISSTVSDSLVLRKFSDSEMDYEKYRRETDARWRQFWQIAEDLNQKRSEAISLGYDAYTDLPWLVLTDGCALIRECSSTELLVHNDGHILRDQRQSIEDSWHHRNLRSELGDQPEDAAPLVALAATFRRNFSPELSQACRTALNAEIFTETSSSAPDRLAAFNGRCRFAELVTDAMFDSIFAMIETDIGLNKLTNDLFFSVLDTIPLGFPGKDSELLSTEFGRGATVQGVLEAIYLNKQVLYDLLMFAVFIEAESSQDERPRFDGVDLFATLIELLKEYEMLSWLGSHARLPSGKSTGGGAANGSAPETMAVSRDIHQRKSLTILEDLFAVHIKPRPAVGVPQSFILTQQIRDVISWITRQGGVPFPNILVFIQCDLLASGNIDLASDFLRFQPNTGWGTYVKGRLYIAKAEFDTAAEYFQKAAYILSHGKAIGNLNEMSSNLLDIISVNSFYDGLPKYFQHILTLFEQARSFSHVSEFAHLALQALESDPDKSEQNTDYVHLRTDLLSRVFHASLKTCQFDEAYSALSRYSDAALQKSALTSLITTLLTAYGPGTAGLKKILRFPLSLAPNLCSHVDEVFTSLARKQSTSSSSLGQNLPGATWQGENDAPDYTRILQAYRIARSDFRGAAEVSYQTVQRLRSARDRPSRPTKLNRTIAQEAVDEDDLESQELRHELLALINLLACMDKNEAYILVEPAEQLRDARRDSAISNGAEDGSVFLDTSTIIKSPTNRIFSDSHSNSPALGRSPSLSSARRFSQSSATSPHVSVPGQELGKKRVIVTLDDVRREYQAELDRVSRIQTGDWEFGGVGKDVEMDDGDGMDTL